MFTVYIFGFMTKLNDASTVNFLVYCFLLISFSFIFLIILFLSNHYILIPLCLKTLILSIVLIDLISP